MEEELTLLGFVAVILSSPFLGVPSFLPDLAGNAVFFSFHLLYLFSTTLLFLLKVTSFLPFLTADFPSVPDYFSSASSRILA